MEKLYCSTCKKYTDHENDICSICESVYDHSKKRYIICGASNNPEVIAAKLKFFEENPEAIIIDEEEAWANKTKILISDSEPSYLKMMNDDIMRTCEDIKYSHLSKKEREANIEPVRTEPKILRNDPCPCGSGLKYKHCCLNK
jgi:uncharacterized protein YecA (UPF0149 family)